MSEPQRLDAKRGIVCPNCGNIIPILPLSCRHHPSYPIPKTPLKLIEVHHTDPLRKAASTAAMELYTANKNIIFIQVRQQPTLAMPPQPSHPAADLLKSYAKNRFLAKVGPQWTLASIMTGIEKGPHKSATSQQSTAFCRRELLERS